MGNTGLDEAQAELKFAQSNISITSDMQMTPLLWQKVKKNFLRSLLDESERGE